MKKIIPMILVVVVILSGCSIMNVSEMDSSKSSANYGVLNIGIEFPNILYYSGEPQIDISDYLSGTWRPASGGTGLREIVELKEVPVEGIKKGIHITGTAESRSYTDVAIDSVPLEYGETYILSCYARGSGQLHLQHGKDPWPCVIYDISNEWARYSYMFTNGNGDGSTIESPANNIYIGVNARVDSDMIICGMKLEKVHASIWTRNPEEIQKGA